MKTLALIVLCAGMVSADQGADSFATGFANSLQRALEIQQQRQQEQQAHQPNVVRGHYDVRDNYGDLGRMQFDSFTQCQRYLDNSQLYKSCVWVED